MVEALRSALLIYFDRRIYVVDTSILQPHVVKVRDCLSHLEPAATGTVYGSIRLLWPAFIAACETEDPNIRSFFRPGSRTPCSEAGYVVSTMRKPVSNAFGNSSGGAPRHMRRGLNT
jgi:arginine metabolism regulation protein II